MESNQVEIKKKSWVKSEEVFKLVMCLVVALWSICLKYFFEFRTKLSQENLEYYEFKYGWFILVGFLFKMYLYYNLAWNYFDKFVLLDKYQGYSRRLKLESILKLSYDTVFYFCTSITCFFLFRDEPWFPNWVGGSGRCENIFLNYPAIPSSKKNQLEMFYALQLGVHIFSVFEIMVIKRKTELKYYEKMLHHILAASLIGFSAMINTVLVGVMVLFTHDSSDIMMAMLRTYGQYKNQKKCIMIPLILMTLLTWIYMRLIVFPFCLISNIHVDEPGPTNPWGMVFYPVNLLKYKLVVLVGMHIFWTYHLVRSILLSLRKNNFVNYHETDMLKNKPPAVA